MAFPKTEGKIIVGITERSNLEFFGIPWISYPRCLVMWENIKMGEDIRILSQNNLKFKYLPPFLIFSHITRNRGSE
jgi:hypothetical protein